MSRRFLDNKNEIDRLKRISENEISPLDVLDLFEYLKKPYFEAYFFRNLENPVWVHILYEQGYFNCAPSVISDKGVVEIPYWHAGFYLEKIAKFEPDTVIAIAKNIQTNNPRAIENILRALQNISPKCSSKIAEYISHWIDIEYRNDYFLFEFGKLLTFWCDVEEVDSAFLILAKLFEPLPQEQTEKKHYLLDEGIKSKFSQGTFYIEKIWEQNQVKFLEIAPKKLLELFEKYLSFSVEVYKKNRDPENKYKDSSFWRKAIEGHSQNSSRSTIKDIYVTGIRDALLKLISTEVDFCKAIINKYLYGKWAIFRRIAIYVLRFGDEFYDDIVHSVLMDKTFFDDVDLHHEYYWLLHDKFKVLSEDEQREYLQWLEVDDAIVKERANDIAEYENREVTEDDITLVRDGMWVRKVWPIKDYLVGDRRKRLQKILDITGREPEYPDFTSWTSTTSSLSKESDSVISSRKLSELSISELLEFIEKYEPEDPSFSKSKERLAENFEIIVMENADKFLDQIEKIVTSKLEEIYQYYFIRAYTNLIKHDHSRQYEKLFPWIENYLYQQYVIDQAGDENNFFFRSIYREIARFLQVLLSQSEYEITLEGKEKVFHYIEKLFEFPEKRGEEYSEEKWDLPTESLNSVRPLAFHSLINYLWYFNYFEKQNSKEDFETYIPNKILIILNDKLNPENEPNLAIRAVYGWRYAFLYPYNVNWAKDIVDKLFPQSEKLFDYWLAAWQGYVTMSNFYLEIFDLLISNYQKALLSYEKLNQITGGLREVYLRLSEHIMLAFLEGKIGITSSDELISLFYKNSNSNERAHAINWLSQVISEEKYWSSCKDLWEFRLDEAISSENPENFSEEISQFTGWLDKIPLEFSEAECFINKMIPFLEEHYDHKAILDFCLRHADKYPEETIDILYELRQKPIKYWFMVEEEGELIKGVYNSGNNKAKEKVLDLLNFLAEERLDFEWIDLME